MLQKFSNLLLIKSGEQRQVFYFLTLFFCVGAGMALGRGASEALFFKRYGIEYLPLMYIITSVVLCMVSIVYAAFVDRLPSETFYKILFTLLALSLFGNWYAASYSTTKLVYPVFFLLYEVASELLLIHSAVYISQNFVQTQSKRLTPIILAGHQIGVIFGGILLATASPYLGVKNIMLLWMLFLFVSFVIIKYWHSNNGISPYFRAGRKGISRLEQSLDQLLQGMKLMKSSRLLRMSSFSLFFMVVSVYILAFAVNTIYTEHFETEESLSAFFGILTAATGLLALVIQLFFTNRLIRNQGVKRVNYIFPLTSIFSYSALLFSFALPAAIFASFNKDTLMPAFAKPVRNIFISSLPSQLQGRAQAIAGVLVIPLGLACAGLFLLLTQNIGDINNFLIIGLASAIAYLIFNSEMNQSYAQEILSNLKKRLFVPDKYINRFLQGNQKEVIKNIEDGVMSEDDDISVVYACVLSKSAPDRALQLIPTRMKNTSVAIKDQMIKILHSIESADLRKNLIEQIGTGDTHLDATILRALFHSRELKEKYRVATLLDHKKPRLKAAAIYGALHYPVPELIDKAIDEWVGLLKSEKTENYMPAIELLTPEFKALYMVPDLRNNVQQKLKKMLLHDNDQCIKLALNILSTWPTGSFDDIEDIILTLSSHSNWAIRNACITTSHLIDARDRENLLFVALDDQHPNVRSNAIKLLVSAQADDITYIQDLLISRQIESPRTIQTMLEYLMDIGANASTMHSISISIVRHATKLKLASIYLNDYNVGESREATLLIHALEERVTKITDLALYAIQTSSHEEDIAIIRAGLSSNDSRQFANAYELLTMINNKELRKLILPLFDENMSTRKTQNDIIPFDSTSTLITWIEKRSDPWLNECVKYFSATLNNKTYV